MTDSKAKSAMPEAPPVDAGPLAEAAAAGSISVSPLAEPQAETGAAVGIADTVKVETAQAQAIPSTSASADATAESLVVPVLQPPTFPQLAVADAVEGCKAVDPAWVLTASERPAPYIAPR